MVIAVNSTFFLKSAGNDFVFDYFLSVAPSKPEHQFIFITPFAIAENLISSKNISNIISYPAANHPLMWKIWLNYTLPGIARKLAVDLLIHTDAVCSLRTRANQYLFISDLSVLSSPLFLFKKTTEFF